MVLSAFKFLYKKEYYTAVSSLYLHFIQPKVKKGTGELHSNYKKKRLLLNFTNMALALYTVKRVSQ